VSLAVHAEREIHGLVPHGALVADLHAQRVEDDDGIHPVEKALLPATPSSVITLMTLGAIST
jgi:hypothetical protein